jgi:NADH:ubiquinone oxidoreductase subunit 4 (subunit M)
LIIGAVYMLRAIRGMLHGPLPDQWAGVIDANFWRKVPFILLLASLLVFGCYPRFLTDKIEPCVSEKVVVTLLTR